MQRAITKNVCVAIALLVAAATLAVLETRVLSQPPSSAWFFVASVLALLGFAWVNAAAFAHLRPAPRTFVVGALVVLIWLTAVFVAVTVGVNLKFALGGHV